MRSDRILANMHKVIRHDLPNEMVALQSLLQFLTDEESLRLSDNGREYVQRLQNTAQRACEMVRFLKQMEQLNAYTPRMADLDLGALGRELQGELQRQLPEKRFAFQWHWSRPTIVSDSRALSRAILSIVCALMEDSAANCIFTAGSQNQTTGVELVCMLEEIAAPPGPFKKQRWNQRNLDQSLNIVLAREWLALTDAVLEIAPPDGHRATFRIMVTDR